LSSLEGGGWMLVGWWAVLRGQRLSFVLSLFMAVGLSFVGGNTCWWVVSVVDG